MLLQDVNQIIQDTKTTRFVVKNIAKDQKTINIFTYPIEAGFTRDLLSIPFISEADIRYHLLKGEILLKLLAKEIIVTDTNIDLLQFDDAHKAFLKSVGVARGTEVDETELTITLQNKIDNAASGGMPIRFHDNIPLLGTKNGINRTFSTPNKFINGTYLGSEYSIIIRHNGRVLDPFTEYNLMESGGLGTGYDTIIFLTFAPSAQSRLLSDYVTLP